MTQEQRILDYLKTGNTITPIEALNLFNCMRLAARIKNLRDRGIDVKCTMIKSNSGKRFAEYHL